MSLYWVRSGSPLAMGPAKSYTRPSDAKESAVKKFLTLENHCLRYDKAAHARLREVIASIRGIQADAGWLAGQQEWARSSRDRPMHWQLVLGSGLKLQVEMWKT